MSFANRFLVTSMFVLAFTPRPAAAAQPESTVTIDSRIQTAIQGFPGSVSLFAKNLDTGKSYDELKRQRDLQGVGRDMKDTVVASKSGALGRLPPTEPRQCWDLNLRRD